MGHGINSSIYYMNLMFRHVTTHSHVLQIQICFKSWYPMVGFGRMRGWIFTLELMDENPLKNFNATILEYGNNFY